MKIGLVFNGGGGKGAYQVGVMKALYELNIHHYVQAIAGTSVGALNAALFLNNSIETAEKVWQTISPDKILTLKGTEQAKKLMNLGVNSSSPLIARLLKAEGYGVFSRSGLLEIIYENINLQKISDKKIPFYATCVKWPTMEKTYFKVNGLAPLKIEKILLATSAIPGVFPSVEIDGVQYVDGGLSDNSPIQPVYDEGCDFIFVISLNRDDTIEQQFPNAKVIQLVPKEAQGGFVSGTLDFKATTAQRRMVEGYNDTMEIIAPTIRTMKREANLFNLMEKFSEEEKMFQLNQKQQTDQFNKDMSDLFAQLEKGK
ncbi:NTE family protein [Ureibacillus xyleni]|uniref:NTE family protein n=1 Tax=Ureibacillus xyleni TaxID=614648 RepID=A0A285S8H6_9BACL|nr:patatin-like phospholipase family protein [Ureibacillus xyleni]SOC03319.1 NTE family protein [Ureibacillus xyleni]